MDKVLAIFRIPELRSRVMTTLLLLFVYRLGFHIPLPGVDLSSIAEAANKADENALFGIMNAFTGAGVGQAVLFSLGVMPYISASIIFSLLTKVVPSLEKLSKEGAAGQRKIAQYTRLSTIPICLVQAMFVVFGVLNKKAPGTNIDMLSTTVQEYYALYIIIVMLALTAGTMFIMWVGEQITEHGVGNGISLIIMAGIVAQLWPTMSRLILSQNDTGGDAFQTMLMFLLTWAIMVVAVVFMTKAQRRIPIRQAKQARGHVDARGMADVTGTSCDISG